jgi:hypothetical protein
MDDVALSDAAILWRRVPPGRWNDDARPDGSAFRARSGENVSVDVAAIHEARGEGPECMRLVLPGCGVVSVTALDVRYVGADVALVDEEGNPAHGEIFGLGRQPARRLVDRCVVLILPD